MCREMTDLRAGTAQRGQNRASVSSLDEQPTISQPEFAIKVAKEAESEQPVNPPVFREIVGVYLEVRELEAEAGEALDVDQEALLVTDGRAHHGDLIACSRAVADLVKHLWNHDGLGRTGIEDDVETRAFPAWSPDTTRYDDKVTTRIEASNLHESPKRGIGPRIRPVKKQPTF